MPCKRLRHLLQTYHANKVRYRFNSAVNSANRPAKLRQINEGKFERLASWFSSLKPQADVSAKLELWIDKIDVRHLTAVHTKVFPFIRYNKDRDTFEFRFFTGFKLLLFFICCFRMLYYLLSVLFLSKWEDLDTTELAYKIIGLFTVVFELTTFVCSATAYSKAADFNCFLETLDNFDKRYALAWDPSQNYVSYLCRKNGGQQRTNQASLLNMTNYRMRKLVTIAVILGMDVGILLWLPTYFFMGRYAYSPLEFWYADPDIGYLCWIVEVVWTLPCVTYAAVAVVIFVNIFCSWTQNALIFLLELEIRSREDVTSVEALNEVLRTYTWFRRFTALGNELLDYLLPCMQVVPVCCTVLLNWTMIRIAFAEDSVSGQLDYLLFMFCIAFLILASCSSLILFYAFNRLSKVSSQVIQNLRTHSANFTMATPRDEQIQHELEIIRRELKALRTVRIENFVDGPVTSMAGVYYVMHVMDYTISALLFFE